MLSPKSIVWPAFGILSSWLVYQRQTCPAGDSPPPTVTLAYGKVIGTTNVQPTYPGATVKQFLGVPFASPPERFLPAVPPVPWESPLNAQELKPSCHQQFIREHYREIFNSPPLPESEDCLYLNIFAPASATVGSGTPVLFWIHGGNYQIGSGRHHEFDGSSIAANENVVVVTINYRLGVFGFPASPEIPLEQRNLGLLDQRLALKWVHENIGAFGGDPAKVTLVGESAGAYSVKQILANPPEPLSFRAAILQSQARGVQGDGDKSWETLANDLGCSGEASGASQLSCVQAAPVEKIRQVIDRYDLGFAPAIDGTTDLGNFAHALEQGNAAKVPLMMGTNADEGTMLAMIFPPPRIALGSIFQNDATAVEHVLSTYPANASEFELKSRIITDFAYTCTTSALATIAANAGQAVWRYYFDASFPNLQPFPRAGVWHTSENSLIFGTYLRDNQTTPQQVRLSRYMQHTWSQFAKDPEAGPGWPQVGKAVRDVQVMGGNGTSWGELIEGKTLDSVCNVYWPAIAAIGV